MGVNTRVQVGTASKNHSFHSRAFTLSKASVSGNKTIDESWNK